MRWKDFPHQREPFEEDVGDVEDCKEPLVVGGGEMELFLHSCYLCVSVDKSYQRMGSALMGSHASMCACVPNIRSVQIRQEISMPVSAFPQNLQGK